MVWLTGNETYVNTDHITHADRTATPNMIRWDLFMSSGEEVTLSDDVQPDLVKALDQFMEDHVFCVRASLRSG